MTNSIQVTATLVSAAGSTAAGAGIVASTATAPSAIAVGVGALSGAWVGGPVGAIAGGWIGSFVTISTAPTWAPIALAGGVAVATAGATVVGYKAIQNMRVSKK